MLAFRLKKIEYDFERRREITEEIVFIDSKEKLAEDKMSDYIDAIPSIRFYVADGRVFPQFIVEKVTIH